MANVTALHKKSEASMNQYLDEIEELITSLSAVGELMNPDPEISPNVRDQMAILVGYLTRQLHKKLEQARSVKI